MLPREKLREMGVESLTVPELLSVLIGTGTQKQNVFELCDSITKRTDFRKSFLEKRVEYWTQIHGIGFSKAARLVAGFELAVRMLYPSSAKPKIGNSGDVFQFLQSEIVDTQIENFFILCLNSQNEIVFSKKIHTGFHDFVLTDMKQIFSTILQTGAKSFICAHNHPSGNITPSLEDRALTEKIIYASKILDLQCLDHVIVSTLGCYSFSENEPELFRA